MIVKVEQKHIDAARKLYRETKARRSPLHFALNDAFDSNPLRSYDGKKIINLLYDQKTTDRVVVVTLARDRISHQHGWLVPIPGQVVTPQSYLLDWDFAGVAEPVEFLYIE